MDAATTLDLRRNDREREHPLASGLRAARHNLGPAMALQAVALALVLGYYFVEPVHEGLEWVRSIRVAGGLWYTTIATALFGGLIPFLALRLRDPKAREARWRFAAFSLVFWAEKGIETDVLYRLQAELFGHDASPLSVAAKTLADQFLFVPLWAVPSMLIAFSWAREGFSVSRAWAAFRPGWVRREMLPLLLMAWLVWIPAVAVIYCLPLALQLPIQNLVLCIWSLMLIFVVNDQSGRVVQSESLAQ